MRCYISCFIKPVQTEQDSEGSASFQSEGAGLLHSGQHLLIKHGEGLVGGQVQSVEAGVSSEGKSQKHNTLVTD